MSCWSPCNYSSMFKQETVAKEINSHVHPAFPKKAFRICAFPFIAFKDMHACGPPYSNFWDMTFLRVLHVHIRLEVLFLFCAVCNHLLHTSSTTQTAWWVSSALSVLLKKKKKNSGSRMVVWEGSGVGCNSVGTIQTYALFDYNRFITGGLGCYASFMGPTAHWAEVTQAWHLAQRQGWPNMPTLCSGSNVPRSPPKHPNELPLPLHFCTLIKFDKPTANSSRWSVIIKYLKNKGEPLLLCSVSTAC